MSIILQSEQLIEMKEQAEKKTWFLLEEALSTGV